MACNMDWNTSEYAVPEEDLTSRPMEGVTSPAPLGHSVVQLHLDSQPSRNKLKPDQSGDPVPNMDGSGDPVSRPAPSELAEHSTSVEHRLRPGYPVPDDIPRRKMGLYGNQTVSDLLVDSNTDGGSDHSAEAGTI